MWNSSAVIRHGPLFPSPSTADSSNVLSLIIFTLGVWLSSMRRTILLLFTVQHLAYFLNKRGEFKLLAWLLGLGWSHNNNNNNKKEWPQTRQLVPWPSTFDPQSPLCMSSASARYHLQAQHASFTVGLLEEVNFPHFTFAHAQAQAQ